MYIKTIGYLSQRTLQDKIEVRLNAPELKQANILIWRQTVQIAERSVSDKIYVLRLRWVWVQTIYTETTSISAVYYNLRHDETESQNLAAKALNVYYYERCLLYNNFIIQTVYVY